jgi:hypothetical protein
MKPLPTRSDLEEQGYGSVLDWALDRERQSATTLPAGEGGSDGAADGEGAAEAGAGAAGAVAAVAGEGGVLVRPVSATAAAAAANNGGYARPLYAKLDVLLDLVARRLYWDPLQPESCYSAEALLRQLKKIDKELGP